MFIHSGVESSSIIEPAAKISPTFDYGTPDLDSFPRSRGISKKSKEGTDVGMFDRKRTGTPEFKRPRTSTTPRMIFPVERVCKIFNSLLGSCRGCSVARGHKSETFRDVRICRTSISLYRHGATEKLISIQSWYIHISTLSRNLLYPETDSNVSRVSRSLSRYPENLKILGTHA